MSNPDKDFPNDPDRFTPLQDVPDLQDPEVMPDPVMDRRLTSWAQQVEAESDAAGHEAKPSSPPWPPLSREQVVELHEALVAFQEEMRTDDTTYRDNPVALNQAHGAAARGLRMVLWSLNIGTPQPPPRQEENLGGFACLDERRMGPPLDADVQTMRGTLAELEEIQRQRDAHQRQRRAQAMEPETSDRLERIRARLNAKPEVKHNCWTCQLLRWARQNGTPQPVCFSGKVAVADWIGIHIPRGATLPSHKADGCPGWTPKA